MSPKEHLFLLIGTLCPLTFISETTTFDLNYMIELNISFLLLSLTLFSIFVLVYMKICFCSDGYFSTWTVLNAFIPMFS